MEFVIVALLLVIVATVIGILTNKHITKNIDKEKCLYDKKTVDIMKTYSLINDEEYRLMLEDLKEKEI